MQALKSIYPVQICDDLFCIFSDIYSVFIIFQALGKNNSAQWLPVSLPGRPVATNSVQTQTVGLFFPSGKQITRKEMEEEERAAVEKQMRDRKPLLTAISPGRGTTC